MTFDTNDYINFKCHNQESCRKCISNFQREREMGIDLFYIDKDDQQCQHQQTCPLGKGTIILSLSSSSMQALLSLLFLCFNLHVIVILLFIYISLIFIGSTSFFMLQIFILFYFFFSLNGLIVVDN